MENNNVLIDKNMDMAINISGRFEALRVSAKKAYSAINDLRFELFNDSITGQEKQLLNDAQQVCNKIEQNYTIYEAKKYIETILSKQQ